MNKKTKVAIIGIIALVLVTVGITYAYWLITRTQEGENVVTTGCLEISLNGSGDITLSDQFPMSDEDGMKLTPYTFTVTNNCNTSVDYYINLESIGDESLALSASSLKVALDDNVTLLSDNYVEPETRIDESYASHRLGYGTLASKGSEGASQTYNLRIWIDANAPISEMNKTFASKISVTVGQGINNPLKEGTIAYNLVSQYGDINEVTEMDPNVKYESLVATGNKSFTASFTYSFGTDYELDEETGKYTLSGDIVQARISQCRTGTKTCGKYTLLTQSTNTSPQISLYEITDFQSTGNYVTANTYKYLNEFDKDIVSGESKVYKAYDDLGTSYYFRGDVTNNYVQLGSDEYEWLQINGYSFEYNNNGTWEIGTAETYEECETLRATYDEAYDCYANEEYVMTERPLYWRIIRVNGDGTIRMVFDGPELIENGGKRIAEIATSAFNADDNDLKYFGYTYNDGSKEVDSTAKSLVDSWYEKILKEKYGKYIADGIFCNDKNITAYYAYDENDDLMEVPEGEPYAEVIFHPYTRVNLDTPSFKCTNNTDKYTVSKKKGNGLLKNPVGLITVDEAKFVGGKYLDTGLYGNSTITMSACMWKESAVFMCSDDLSGYYGEGAIRPVINLKADVEFTGNGTIDSPYQIVTE